MNPVLVEITRGFAVESHHTGAIAIVDDQGNLRLALGDIEAQVYPRSAAKVLQALPVVESGAAERFGLSEHELAITCASHSGDQLHVEAVTGMLRRLSLETAALCCGPQWPIGVAESRELAASGKQPTALHNPCSGKHAGFLAVAKALGHPLEGYERPEHPVQGVVRTVLEEMTGVSTDVSRCGTDACSVPTYRFSLRSLALAFARFGSGAGLGERRAEAARRLRAAIAQNPMMLAGRGRFDTVMMSRLGARLICKVGSEGMYAAAIPERRLGIVLKVDDGAPRASEVAVGAIVRRALPIGGADLAALTSTLEPIVRTSSGDEIGRMRVSSKLADAVASLA